MDYNKIEDAIFKLAMEVFSKGAVDFFKLDVNLKSEYKTELKNIDIKTGQLDYLFLTDKDDFIHFEFQTTDKSDDISRFLYYDASLYCKTEKSIRTIVVYSSEIANVNTYLDCGTIKYKIEPFYMISYDGDEFYNKIKAKINNKEDLSQADILTLSFLPLMNSNSKSKSDITLDSIELANKIENPNYRHNSLSMLYALLDKFGNEKAKRKLKEVIEMTDVGRMIYEEGIAEGTAKGKAEGIRETLTKLLSKKLKVQASVFDNLLIKADTEKLSKILEDIFEIDSLEDVKKYLN